MTTKSEPLNTKVYFTVAFGSSENGKMSISMTFFLTLPISTVHGDLTPLLIPMRCGYHLWKRLLLSMFFNLFHYHAALSVILFAILWKLQYWHRIMRILIIYCYDIVCLIVNFNNTVIKYVMSEIFNVLWPHTLDDIFTICWRYCLMTATILLLFQIW